ncbi:MAG: PASTA domain-containing protein [Clostridia bacterium]|nr:PASTA domain-containing protein [Clostridia bacterium]
MKNLSSKIKKRTVILLAFFLILATLICIALFKLQIIENSTYQNNVFEQLTIETSVNPLRGSIYDRNGVTLASNKTVWILYLVPKNIENPEFVARQLSKILNEKYETIFEKANKRGYKYQVIDNDLEKNTVDEIRKLIKEHSLEDQIQLSASSKRYYPFSNLASHTLGFVNADGVGIYGLEKVYNNIIEGTNGKYITAQDAQSNDMPFQYEEYIEDENGYNLVSTLDLYIQYQLEEQLRLASIESGAQNRSAGIVMNPKTGEIYAMAVYPSFDLNQPYVLDEQSANKLSELEKGSKEYNTQYYNSLFAMWNNKAVTELYEPGSTFKIVTTSVALQEGASSLNERFTCTGALKIDGFYRAISCHKRKGHGNISFSEALQQSCNPSMMKLAFSIGRETFYEYFKKFGYTGKTGIDLPSEAKGYYHSFENFSNVSLAVYSFGQTFKTTAIQQLRAISIIANGGYDVTPHFLKKIVDNDGNVIFENEATTKNQIIDSDICATITQILKEGVDGEGGAKNAYVAGYSIAAKTGTSEKKDKYDEQGNTSYRVSSCVAYAPSEDAQVAVIILVDEPTIGSKYGSVVAAPYVSKLLELILPYLGIKAVYNDSDIEHEQIKVPSVEGKSISEAVALLKEQSISYEVIGNGDKVITQMPRENSVIYKKTGKILLYTEKNDGNYSIVPDVISLSAEQANLLIINAGFNIKIEGAGAFKAGSNAKVVSQYPSAGVSLQKGSVITIKLLYDEED